MKFRAWMNNDKHPAGHMYTPNENPEFVINFHGDVVEVCDGNKVVWARIGNNGILLMQYTGIHDKNGQEIYEGDILQEDDTKAKPTGNPFAVQWANDRAGWNLFEYGEYYEVIGNIYENPELLAVTTSKQ